MKKYLLRKKMISLLKLKSILEENNVSYRSSWKKRHLYELVKNLGLLPPESTESVKRARPVEFKNVFTNEIISFPSLVKAGEFVGKSPQTVANWEGRLWGNKYIVSVGENGYIKD